MNEDSVAVTGAPAPSKFTSSPLRNRLRRELDAPVSRVWELLGRSSPGFPSTAWDSSGSRQWSTTRADASSARASSNRSSSIGTRLRRHGWEAASRAAASRAIRSLRRRGS